MSACRRRARSRRHLGSSVEVEVDVEVQCSAEALDDRDAAGATSRGAPAGSALTLESKDATYEDGEDRTRQGMIPSAAPAQPEGQAQDPLAVPNVREDAVAPVSRGAAWRHPDWKPPPGVHACDARGALRCGERLVAPTLCADPPAVLRCREEHRALRLSPRSRAIRAPVLSVIPVTWPTRCAPMPGPPRKCPPLPGRPADVHGPPPAAAG